MALFSLCLNGSKTKPTLSNSNPIPPSHHCLPSLPDTVFNPLLCDLSFVVLYSTCVHKSSQSQLLAFTTDTFPINSFCFLPPNFRSSPNLSVAMETERGSIPSVRVRQRGKRGKGKADEAESQELGPSFSDLPSPITTHILLRLPIKSVLICKCVCRTWNTLISDPHFAKLHFEHSPLGFMIRTCDPKLVSRTLHLFECEPEKFDPEFNNYVKLEPKFKLPLRDAKLVLDKRDDADCLLACKPKYDKFAVVNSCNGLLCLCDPWNRDPLVVCNPVTGEFIRLPEASKIEKTHRPVFNFYAGFGFQPKTKEYKVIRMWKRFVRAPGYSLGWELEGQSAEILTLGTPTWRNVGVDPDILLWNLEYPTCVNGALHWIVFDSWTWSILCFNFESERLQFFPCPPFIHNGIPQREGVSMGTLGDSLYICNASFSNSVEMWFMKKYGIGNSWTKTFAFDTFGTRYWDIRLCWPIKHFENGAAILEYHSDEGFTYYEPEKHRFKKFLVRGTQVKLFEVIAHIPSLISLKDIVKGDNIEVLNVYSRCAKFKLPEEYEALYLDVAF